MAASQDQSSFNTSPGKPIRFDQNSNSSSNNGTAHMSSASTTAAGHGPHPSDNADESNVTMPGSKVGPQQEDLDGEQMRAPGEGDVMDAQLNKQNAGWGEQNSLTGDLERKKAEQDAARREVKSKRENGLNIDGGAGGRLENEGISQA